MMDPRVKPAGDDVGPGHKRVHARLPTAMPGHDEMGENFFDYITTTLLTTYRAYARLYEPRSLRGVSGDILKAERGVASCGGGL